MWRSSDFNSCRLLAIRLISISSLLLSRPFNKTRGYHVIYNQPSRQGDKASRSVALSPLLVLSCSTWPQLPILCPMIQSDNIIVSLLPQFPLLKPRLSNFPNLASSSYAYSLNTLDCMVVERIVVPQSRPWSNHLDYHFIAIGYPCLVPQHPFIQSQRSWTSSFEFHAFCKSIHVSSIPTYHRIPRAISLRSLSVLSILICGLRTKPSVSLL